MAMPASRYAPQMHADDLSRGRLVLATIAIMTALLLSALDQTIVGTALPRIVAELNGLSYYAWVLTAYMVASTTMVPIAGKLGDMYGRKPFLIVGMVGFVLASALCGQSQDMLELVLFRGLQGVFGGVLMATVFASVADLYPPRERPRVQGYTGAVWGLSSVVGPTLGGFLTDNIGWRWVFYVNLPIGILAVALVLYAIPWTRTVHRHKIDYRGVALLVAGLVPLLTAFSITSDHAWTSPEVLGLLAFAAVALVAFFFNERSATEPIVPFGLFTDRTFTVSTIVGFLVTFGMFGTIIYVVLIYQGVLGIAATNSGLLITPMMLGLVAASILSGQLMIRIKMYRYIGTVGIAIAAAGIGLLSQVTTSSPQIDVVRDLVLAGFGIGTTMPLYVNAVQSALPREITGVVTAQVQFWRNIGGTVGTAMLGSLLAASLPGKIDDEVAKLHLPPQALAALPQGSGNAQALFDPTQVAAARAAMPPAFQPVFDQIIVAVRAALATALHDVFLYGAIVVAVGVVFSLFLREVPLRGRERRPSDVETEAEREEDTAPIAAFGD
ncbi:MAG: MFS transporter [Chloroflexota bacterium]|nr:MFS transporter [Chloroflexota bacterium]MDE3194614.1 MFS transporter [Chloroflexota bacterium]